MKSYVNGYSFLFFLIIAFFWFYVRADRSPTQILKAKFVDRKYSYEDSCIVFKNDTILEIKGKNESDLFLSALFSIDSKYQMIAHSDSIIEATNNFIKIKLYYNERHDSLIFKEIRVYFPDNDYCP